MKDCYSVGQSGVGREGEEKVFNPEGWKRSCDTVNAITFGDEGFCFSQESGVS